LDGKWDGKCDDGADDELRIAGVAVDGLVGRNTWRHPIPLSSAGKGFQLLLLRSGVDAGGCRRRAVAPVAAGTDDVRHHVAVLPASMLPPSVVRKFAAAVLQVGVCRPSPEIDQSNKSEIPPGSSWILSHR
jgi:hypothetical protein